MAKFSGSTVEDAALSWFDEQGYSVVQGQLIAPDSPTAERVEFSEVILTERFRAALWKLNSEVTTDAIEEAVRKVTVPQPPPAL